MGCWQANLGGSFHLRSPEQELSVPRGKKARALLAYLSARAGTHIRREHLSDLLWGDRGKSQARDSLRQALTEIRRCVGDLIQSDRECVWIEADRFVFCEDNGDEYLADLDHITPEWDFWLSAERRRRSEIRWEALKLDAEHFLSEGKAAAALRCTAQMEQIDRYHEEWVRLAMRAEFLAGSPGRIDQRFRAISEMLHRELGVEPAAQTRALRDELIAELSTWPNTQEADLKRSKQLDRPLAETNTMRAASKFSAFTTLGSMRIAAICTTTAMVVGAAFLIAPNLRPSVTALRSQCCFSPPSKDRHGFVNGKSASESGPTCPG